ncbi:unnamed protein product [Sympodiomycopsis kandeliae]
MPEPAEAGPSRVTNPVEADTDLIWCTYRDLNEHLEGIRRTRPIHEIQTLVESRLHRLKQCVTIASPSSSLSSASQSQITSGKVKLENGTQVTIDEEQRSLVQAISNRYQMDQVQAFVHLRSFLQSEERSLDILVSGSKDEKGKASSNQQPKLSSMTEELLDAFNVFYFDEQLYLLRCVSALLRIAEDQNAEYYSIAQSTLSTLATPAFARECTQRFEALLQKPLPSEIRDAPRYSRFWAKQGLKQQIALLEVLFLLYYGHLTPDAPYVLSLLTIIQQTDMGQRQANDAFFDAEAIQLLTALSHLLAFIAIESLDLERAMDGYQLTTQPQQQHSSPSNILVESAQSLSTALDLLENTRPDSGQGQAPILLAWSLVLRKLQDALADLAQDNPRLPDHLQQVQDVLTPQDAGQPIWTRLASAALSPQMALFPTMRAMARSPFLATDSSSAPFEVSVASSLAMRAVFKGLLLGTTEVVLPEYIPDFDSLVSLWQDTFDASVTADVSAGTAAGVAALANQFWEVDSEHETRSSVLLTAARRWPIHFTPLLRLLKALTGTCGSTTAAVTDSPANKATLRVLQQFGSITSIAQTLSPKSSLLRPPWEVIESPDYNVLDYRAVRTIPLFGSRFVIKPGTCGRMVSEMNKQPVVVVWDLQDDPISGWRLIRDVLASFVKLLPESGPAASNTSRRLGRSRQEDEDPFGASTSSRSNADFSDLSPDASDRAVIATDILDLFAAVLAGAPDQAAHLLDHLDDSQSQDIAGADPDESITDAGMRPTQPSLIAITQRILDQALASHHNMPTRLVSSAYKLLSLLLPFRPTEVWLALRSSNLITGSSGQASWTKGSEAFNTTSSSLLTHECIKGSFHGLHSLLDLHANLLSEMQRSQLAVSPDLLRIKVDVMLRALHWTSESVWPEHQSWRFNKALDRLSIGAACTRMLLDILSDRTLTHGPAKEISQAVSNLLVSHATLLHLAPLVNALATGQEVLSRYYRSGFHAEAEKTHDLIISSLRLAKEIIEHRQQLSSQGKSRLCLFERMFFDGSAVAVRSLPSGSRRSSRVELINTIFAYLSQGLSIDLCQEAALLITSVCLSTRQPDNIKPSSGQTLSLIGHLGTVDEVKSAMSSILDLLANTHQDTHLRSILWTMVSAVTQTQPALAAILLRGVEFGAPSSDVVDFGARPKMDQDSSSGDHRTALQIAADAVIIWEAYWEGQDVVLLDALLHFLGSVWAQPENTSALAAIRKDERFWKALVAMIVAKEDAPPEDPTAMFAEQEGSRLMTEHDEVVRSFAYRMTIKARALYILSSDLDIPVGSRGTGTTSLSVEHATRLVNQGHDFSSSLESVFHFFCNPALHADVEARMSSSFPEVPLSILRNPPKRHEFDLHREFGDGYVYSTDALRRKLEGFCEGNDNDDGDMGRDETQVDEHVIQQAVLLVSSVNLDWSIIDSQAALLRSWTAFLESFSRRIRRTHKAQQQEKEMQSSCLQAWISAAKIAVEEERQGSLMSGVHAERVKLLQVLLEAAWGDEVLSSKPASKDGKTADVEQLAEIVHRVNQLLSHNCFTLQSSLRRSERTPYHRELLALVLLCSRRSRQVLPLAEGRQLCQSVSISHKTIHTAIDSYTSHAVTALRVIIDNALQLLDLNKRSSENDGALIEAEEELTLVCSLFEVLIRSDVSLAPHFWLNQLQENAVLPACVNLLRRASVRQQHKQQEEITQAPIFMPSILSLFLAMASQQQPAEQTVLAGLMTALCSNALSPALESGTLIAGSAAHVCWVTMLRLVVSIVENFDGGVDSDTASSSWASASSRFIEMELMGFVRLYGAQLGRGLEFHPLPTHADDDATPVSVAHLHELHAVVRLFLVMASAESFAERSGVEVLSVFASRTAAILPPLVHLLQRPHQLASLLRGGDLSMEEDKPATSTSDTHQPLITSLMSGIASTSISALWYSSSSLETLCTDSHFGSTEPFLRLTMRTGPLQPLSIGTLLDLVSYHLDKEDGNHTTIEQSLAIIVAQYKLNKGGKGVESGIMRDVESVITKAISAVKDKEWLEWLDCVCKGFV